jgi:hypothetical protein
MGSIGVRGAAALLGYDFLGLCGFSCCICGGRARFFGPVINIVASLWAGVRFFGSALRMGALAAGFMFLLGAD